MMADVITSTISKVMQSNESFLTAAPIIVRVHHVNMPNGCGRYKTVNLATFSDFCRSKRSIITIKNGDDNQCLARAIVVAMSRAVDDEAVFKRVRDDTSMMQKNRAIELCRRAGVVLSNGGGNPEMHAFQQELKGWKITVFKDRKGREVLFEGPDVDSEVEGQRRRIDLIFGDKHFNVITSLSGAFSCSYYCTSCKRPYNTRTDHVCQSSCRRCGSKTVCRGRNVECNVCNRVFLEGVCYQNHLKAESHNTKPLCSLLKKCKDCGIVYKTAGRKIPHICGENFCFNCNIHHVDEHYCYMQIDKKTPGSKSDTLHVFYDLECRQDVVLPGETNVFQHIPTLCVTQQACKTCWYFEDAQHICSSCGVRQHIFHDDDPVAQLIQYLRIPRRD
ncbi:hypothetical protein J437_LFUL018484 [Ladona fulva]|uniref:C2H2-type domain-containing protein n=1 Tax=Ladona fulva TaxID=123851 RepID=A0A8K0K459_LADFU|nr:hypothetical protein J437_LFUL018487 [Ladona fulva]KAG8225675.1 hypothetical protein J437_LFUL018484 [Ladona fulva]